MNLRQALELRKLTVTFFSMDLMLLGNNIWVRSYLPTAAVLFITDYFLAATAQGLLRIISIPVQFLLIQKAAEHFAQKRFGLKVLQSCWWSIWWRATLYTIAIGLVAVIAITIILYPSLRGLDVDSMSAEELAEEISARDPLNMGVDSAIILFLLYILGSFLAVGYAAVRAFRVSCIKTRQCPEHVTIEDVLEEEEREKQAEQQERPSQTATASPASAATSRYESPPEYAYNSQTPPKRTANPTVEMPSPAQTTEQEDLSRYMPPEQRPHEEAYQQKEGIHQPTDLVGAAPGYGERRDSRKQRSEENESKPGGRPSHEQTDG